MSAPVVPSPTPPYARELEPDAGTPEVVQDSDGPVVPSPIPPYAMEMESEPTTVSKFAGSGSPEGVVQASPGSRPYLDLDTEQVYLKKTGHGKTGWIQVIG